MVDYYPMKEIVGSGGGGRKQGGATPPCAACKLLRRRCAKDCVFASYFPADEPQKFASVHKVFGASNINKMLQELKEDQRGDAVSAMVYEANARVRDPVYGCVGAISSLQQQIDHLHSQLALAQAEVVQMRMQMHHYSNNNNNNNNNNNYNNNNNNSSTISTSPDDHYTNNNSYDSPSSSRHTNSFNSRNSFFNMEDTFWSS